MAFTGLGALTEGAWKHQVVILVQYTAPATSTQTYVGFKEGSSLGSEIISWGQSAIESIHNNYIYIYISWH